MVTPEPAAADCHEQSHDKLLHLSSAIFKEAITVHRPRAPRECEERGVRRSPAAASLTDREDTTMSTVLVASHVPSRRQLLRCFMALPMTVAVLPTMFGTRPLAAQAVSASARAREAAVAITHVTVIDVATGAKLPDRTVLVRDRHIAIVDTAPRARVPAGTRHIDGRGRFLIPGLWDMHVHLLADRVTRNNLFPLFVANGITGVRNMWGDCDSGCATSDDDVRRPVPAAVVQAWKRDIISGALVGPRIVASSALFEGPSPMFPGSYAIRGPAEAREKVRLAKEHGVDFIKVLPGLSRESYSAVVDEAKLQGLPVAGHVPFAMMPFEVSDAGQRSIEHVDDVLGLGPYPRVTCSTKPDSLRMALAALMMSRDTTTAERARLQNAFRRLLAEGYSETLCAELYAHLARNGTWRVPTLVVHHNGPLGRLGDPLIASDPRLRYVDARIRASWLRPPPGVPPRTAEDSAAIRAVVRVVLSLPGAMQRAGVPLLAGSDEPNPWVIPGFSLPDELALMVRGGLMPLEALRTATLNPARFLHATDSLGVIAPGAVADLVLLDADPLADIRNTARIAAVLINGRVFDRLALDELLAGAERAAGTTTR